VKRSELEKFTGAFRKYFNTSIISVPLGLSSTSISEGVVMSEIDKLYGLFERFLKDNLKLLCTANYITNTARVELRLNQEILSSISISVGGPIRVNTEVFHETLTQSPGLLSSMVDE
jgi:hypothetical protein